MGIEHFSREQYTAHDKRSLPYRWYKKHQHKQTDSVWVVVHGITAEMRALHDFGMHLKEVGDVVVPTLRGYDLGHPRGDIPMVGTYDRDLEALLNQLRQKGYSRVYWVGHSMGCANLLRLLSYNRDFGDGYVFLSPFFHPSLQVYRRPEGNGQEEGYELKMKKIFLLYFLNRFNIARWSHEKVATIPDEFDEASTLSLSFRLLVSRFVPSIPKDFFSRIEKPIIAAIGSEDEVTDSSKLHKWWKKQTNHLYVELPEEDHNSLLKSKKTVELLEDWAMTMNNS
ncbi:alpha/beta hydrolase [Pontibacillus halophilus]|nr:alpha/beta hydrolase [Pontibacillus halophilus]